MKLPSLYDIFFDNDFSDDVTPELTQAEKEFNAAMDKIVEDYNIPFSVADNVRCGNANEHMMAQYTGFLQGFKWAVQLFTGNKDNEEVA